MLTAQIPLILSSHSSLLVIVFGKILKIPSSVCTELMDVIVSMCRSPKKNFIYEFILQESVLFVLDGFWDHR